MWPTDAPSRTWRSAMCICASLAGCLTGVATAQDGHRISADRVIVNQASHWAAWRGGAGLIEPVGAGIRPLRQRRDVNVALDATSFSVTGDGGVSTPSRQALARHVIDGDSLSWGPDPASPLRDWWVEINLGRLVVVRRIIVRFAEPGFGDPFLQFKVLGWRRGPPTTTRMEYTLRGTSIPRFWEIGRTDRPNKVDRVFEFVPRPTQEANAIFAGDALSHIRIVAIASDSSRAHEVSAQAWSELPADEQGLVEYYRREESGRETRVSPAAWERIDQQRRGTVRYFRRERPRIAEVEILTAGDNVNMGLVQRAGSAIIETQTEPKQIAGPISDGDYGTSHAGPIFDSRAYNFIEDLGALLWVDTMHFLTDGPQPIDHFTLDVSDGALAPDGSILWTPTADASVEGTREFTGGSAASLTASQGIRFREFRLPPTRVRYLRTTFHNPLRVLSNIGINEIMLYGEGFVPEVVLTSDLIAFDRAKNLGAISWQADLPSDTRVYLQSRTGNQLDVDTLYFDSSGTPKTASQYRRLPSSKKGEIQFSSRPGGDWSTWSAPYVEPGSQITSPSPRQYMELRATLQSDRADAAATLQSIQLQLSDPVADGLIAEVFPVTVPGAAAATEFRYFLRPAFSSGTQGFDEILLTATAGTTFGALRHVRISAPGTDSDAGADVAAEWIPTGADSLQIRLPTSLRRDGRLEIGFTATLFANAAAFNGFARQGGTGVWQRVDAGDATDLVRSSSITVLVEGSSLLSELRASTQVLSPNGDGVNDDVVFSFAVSRLARQQPVRLSIHDLAGRLVADRQEHRLDPRGAYAMRWDGTAGSVQGGALVPPGVYLARLQIDVDGAGGAVSRQRLIHIAY